MYKNNNEYKIEKYLDDLAEEYKTLLLNRLLEVSGNIENLNVCDLLRIDNEIKRPFLSEYRRQLRRKRVFQMSGVLYAIMGIMFLSICEIIDSVKSEGMVLLSLVITFMGVIMILMSEMYPNKWYYSNQKVSNNSEESRAILEYRVVSAWRELEGFATDIYSENIILPTGSIISSLLNDNYINQKEADFLKDFLKMRNNIVHDINNNYELDEMRNMLKRVQHIINKLNDNL